MKGEIKMRNLKFILVALFVAVFAPIVRAENSATAYDGKYWSQQVFVTAYNNGASTVTRDNVMILDTTGTAGTTLGGYVTTTTTTDSIYVFGVTDESILSGSLGRICVRGPHKSVSIAVGSSGGTAAYNTIGTIVSTSTTAGRHGFYTTADGTAGGRLGYIINATATTDTGDASGTYWIWVQPNAHK